jgi:EAL domain-containing protein (putative c-di-GMP-specific phosphodiesterase class I)/DNA-binding NarL/FixJ family response regulator
MTQVRVLIADDDRTVREALAELIQSEPGLELVGVASGSEEAIARAEEVQPDVAVLDVRMSGGGGPAAARGIRRASPSTRILALSAYSDRGPVIEMIRAGAAGYLVKGAAITELLNGITAAARGESVLSPAAAHGVVQQLVTQLEGDADSDAKRSQSIARLRHALDSGDPTIVFQPIVDIKTGQTVGFEALARFTAEPYRTPDIWFTEAHAVGLGLELEVTAIENALLRSEALSPQLFVALNASPRTVMSDRLNALMERTSNRKVVIEMTEHAPVDDYEELIAALVKLRGYAIRMAVDDAGAGFASLRHILRLVPDFIKLDVSLTGGIDRDIAKRALARGLVTFATEIGSSIVGEGVESTAELDMLRSLGAEYAQGYHLGRPGPLPLDPVAAG